MPSIYCGMCMNKNVGVGSSLDSGHWRELYLIIKTVAMLLQRIDLPTLLTSPRKTRKQFNQKVPWLDPQIVLCVLGISHSIF